MKMNGSGCVFEYFGRVPPAIYNPGSPRLLNPIESAVHENSVEKLATLLQDGHTPKVTDRIGQMTCIEYSAMMGYSKILQLLIQYSKNAQTLNTFFAISDVVERAYMISRNKSLFFGPNGSLAEANRYEAALFTAVEYNNPECVKVLLEVLGTKEPNKHNFAVQNRHESLSACELAAARGHRDCYDLLNSRQWRTPVTIGLTRRSGRTTSVSYTSNPFEDLLLSHVDVASESSRTSVYQQGSNRLQQIPATITVDSVGSNSTPARTTGGIQQNPTPTGSNTMNRTSVNDRTE